MSEEDKTEAPSEVDDTFPPSNVGNTFREHSRYMDRCKTLPEDRSFAVPKVSEQTGAPLRIALLRKIAATKSVGKLAFVVIEHPNVFEVSRLPDGWNAALFYETIEAERVKGDEAFVDQTAEDLVLSTIQEALTLGQDQRRTYDPAYSKQMAEEGIVTYGYLHRKTTRLKPMRASGMNATERLKVAIKNLCEQGKINLVPAEYVKDTYKTGAKLYRLIED